MADPVANQLCIVTVHAHPDDEASKGAPTLARYKAEGVRTILVCCTGGEEGDINNPALREPGRPFHGLTPEEEKAKLGAIRMDELAESARIIGFDEVVMLDYRDSGMMESDANHHPESFHQADLDEATGRLVAVLRRERAQVVITYSDDQRGYPHPDHLKVHDISVLAFERAGDPAWYPEAGEPFVPSKLYYTVWSKARLLAVHDEFLRTKGESPYDQEWLDRPGHDHRITTRLEIGDYLWARTEALRAHATQVDPEHPWWFGLTDAELAAVYPWEDWVLAASHVGFPAEGEIEDDLFAGIRGPGPVVSTVQYRVVFGKKDEVVEGDDGAALVVEVAAADAGLDPAIAYMQGKLRATGDTGVLFARLKSGEVAATLARLSERA